MADREHTMKLNLELLPQKLAQLREERLAKKAREWVAVGEASDESKVTLHVETRQRPGAPDGEQYQAVIARTASGLDLEVDWVQGIEWSTNCDRDHGEPPRLRVTVLVKPDAKIG